MCFWPKPDGQNLLDIKDGVCAELQGWVKIDPVKKKEEDILEEQGRCRNEQEMSDRRKLITDKLYDAEGWGPFTLSSKVILLCKYCILSHKLW